MKKTLTTLLGVGLLSASALAVSVTGPMTAAQISALTGADDTDYGPSAGANFTDGPLILPTGSTTDLFAGNDPGRELVAALMFVVSIDPASVASLGTVSFTLAGVGTVNFGASDFFSTGALGFPDNISGIGNGDAPGLKFPPSVHAALRVDGLDLGSVTGADLGDVSISSPVDLRVDIFGIATTTIEEEEVWVDTGKKDKKGKPILKKTTVTVAKTVPDYIINNTPNSHSLGVTGGRVPDGGSTLMLVSLALFGLGAWGRKFS